ncbi:MAG: hypothetical protein QM775_03925 [Pirellulales bacterium]
MLSRRPNAEETKLLKEFIARHPEGRPAALADVLWALINSGEFLVNH